ncbi:quinone reductase-like [Patiria miniata]|uniref:NADPH-dependent FMN reductase-like domain-containing protein n=1 Tax=Patiria miniata TaxID=46514 RepID=A0A913ZL26_PATMI|nr:quinone reductase-like [Patiria miniata]
MANKLKIVLFLGTCRENRLGERVAKFMINQLKKDGKHDVEFMDAEEFNLPILKKALFFYKDETQAPQILQDAKKKIIEADGYVFVSGEYNHSIPPGLANMVDHFPTSIFTYKPSAIVCYSPGIYGGMRAAMQLRCFLGEIGCLPVSNIFGIPKCHQAISAEGEAIDDHMEKGAAKIIEQLDWNATAMRNHRQAVGVPK